MSDPSVRSVSLICTSRPGAHGAHRTCKDKENHIRASNYKYMHIYHVQLKGDMSGIR